MNFSDNEKKHENKGGMKINNNAREIIESIYSGTTGELKLLENWTGKEEINKKIEKFFHVYIGVPVVRICTFGI